MSGSGTEEEDIAKFLDRPTQFIVIEQGNVSINTAPILDFTSPVKMIEDEVLYYTIPYIDNENDDVFYYLTTIPRLGSAHVDVNTGLLTYTPCQNCFGTENLGIYIRERELEFGEELDDSGTLQIMIENDDDPLILFFFESISQNDSRLNISSNSIIQVYIEANRTNPVTIAKVGVYDYDGYNDDLEVFVTDGGEGISGYETWLDIVSVSESLPVNWEGNEMKLSTSQDM